MDSSILIQKSLTLATLQFSFRILTFIINLLLVRYLRNDILGLVNVRLLLLYSTIIFISREPFRKVCLGLNINVNTKRVINLMWLIFPSSILICTIMTYIWCEFLSYPVIYNEYKAVVVMYSLSAIIELISEPLWLISQINLMVKFRVSVETSAMCIRIILSTILYFKWPSLGLYAFGISQMAYSAFISISYFVYFYTILSKNTQYDELLNSKLIHTFSDLFPTVSKFEVEVEQFQMIKGFLFNCIIKQALTEGEKYLMTLSDLISLEMQGQYDVISNLGSLAPRLVFSSIEDSCHLAFSKILKQGIKGTNHKKDEVQQSFVILTKSLKVVILLGLTIVVFSQAYSWPLLVLYVGLNKAQHGVMLLRAFSLYVLILSFNGVTECFYYSVINRNELHHHTRRMVWFSLVFVVCGTSLVFMYGVMGLVWANCINMALRIFISMKFIRDFYEQTVCSLTMFIKAVLPNPSVLVTYFLSLIISLLSMIYSYQTLFGQFIHVLVGLVLILFDIGIILITEQEFLDFFKSRLGLFKLKTS